jgi:hypothetical protein
MIRMAAAITFLLATSLQAQQALDSGTTPPAQVVLKPRVLLHLPKRSGGWSTLVNPSLDVNKDFEDACPGVRISFNLYMTDYTVQVSSVQHGPVAQNQMLVSNKDGDLISRINEWGGMRTGVKKVCAAILSDWAKK